MNPILTTAEIAELIGGKLEGSGDIEIKNIAGFANVQENEISFIEKIDLAEQAVNTKAGCLIIHENFDVKLPCASITVKNPKLGFAKIAAKLHPFEWKNNWHESAIISKNSDIRAGFIGAFVTVGENSYIGESSQILDGARIGSNVSIGKCSIIHPNCVIYDNVTIGNDCVIHAGAIIGADGFGYVRDGANGYVKFPQIGTVLIEDEVEIGANTCIDRGALGETRIGKGTKIDNLVQVAHNVQIGERVVIASQTGISGSTIIEDDCVIGGQVGFGDHAKVLKGAIIGSQAGILPNKLSAPVSGGERRFSRSTNINAKNAMVKGLGRLREEIKKLKNQLDELINHSQNK